MTYISDFKGVALSLFKQATSVSTGTGDVDQSLFSVVGERFATADGREVVLVSNGAVALAAGVLVQAPSIIAGHQSLAMTVPTTAPATAGTFLVSVTNGATVINQNQYAGGYLIIQNGAGIGQTLRIASHAGAAVSAQCVITLEDAIVTTLDTSSIVNLIANPYSNVIIAPTIALANVVGVSLYPLAASVAPTYNGASGRQTAAGTQQYGFIQTKGIVSCLSDANVATVGLGLMRSTTTAGTVAVRTATGADVGIALQTTVSARANAIQVDL
jgi:hypothetical protein